MSSPVAYYFAAHIVMLMQNMICPVRGQCTLQGCENGDSLNSIVADIQQMFVDAIRQQQNEQMKNQEEQDICIKHVQSIHELFNASLWQMKNQEEQDICNKQVQSIHELFNASFRRMKTLEEQDICIKHVQSIHELFNASLWQMKNQEEQDICIKQVQSVNDLVNASFQEMKNQQDTAMTSLQAVDRRLREQDIYIKKVEHVYELLNASFQQMKNLDESFQQMKNQQDTAMTSLESVDRRSQDQVQGIHESLNASFHQMKNQQDTAMTRLQAVDRRSQEQDIYIKQVQSIHELLNASFQQLNNQQDTVMTSLRACDQRSQDHVQGIYEFLNASFQQMRNQQDTAMTRLQAADRRSQDQVQSIHVLLNESCQQMKNQQDTVMTSLQAIDRRSQEQDIYIKQILSIHELLNASLQQMKTEHDTVVRSLEAIDRRLSEHDISIKNQTQNSCKLAVGVPVQVESGIDIGGVPVLLPTVNNWIVLLQRFDGSLNFYRIWSEYKNGFGDMSRGEIWLGNEKIHRLTNGRGLVYSLRIEVQLKTSGRWFHADYATFSLDSESNKYTLRVSGFSGSAGDSLTNTTAASHWYQGGMKFTTSDADNDNSPNSNCAQLYQAGWWYNSCWFSCLTCRYDTKFAWESLKYLESGGLLRAARMMIRSK